MFEVIIIYLKVFVFLGFIIASGTIFAKRIISTKRAELVIPVGALLGTAIFIFILNLTTHFLKGSSGIYTSWITQLVLSIIIARKKTPPLRWPKTYKMKWLLVLLISTIFLYTISSHAKTGGADSTIHYSLASVFQRGGYPIRTPWQPDYIAYYHIGGAELLGASRTITSAPFHFLHPFFGFLSLLSVSQILIWLPKPKNKNLLLLLLPAIVGLVSLGSFIIVWPSSLNLPTNIINWISILPTIEQSFEVYGSPANLDALMLFLHRFLALSFLFGLIVIVLNPSIKEARGLVLVLTGVTLLTIALTDETVFFITAPAILLVSFFTLFNKSYKKLVLFTLAIALLAVFQGGIITETILNRYHEKSSVLLFPEDQETPYAKSENYRSYRLQQQKGKFFRGDKYSPLSIYHPGIVLQLVFFAGLYLIFRKKVFNKEISFLLIILLVSSIISLLAFHGLVPKGYTHQNGNRFLTLSYYLSGLGITFLLTELFKKQKPNDALPTLKGGVSFQKKTTYKRSIRPQAEGRGFLECCYKIAQLGIAWFFIFSSLPALLKLYPRQKVNWFIIRPTSTTKTYSWVKNNLPFNSRVLALTDNTPVPVPNIELVRYAGVYTPVWGKKPRAHDSFDISPIYADAYHTLNPSILNSLGIQYLIVKERYLSTLPEDRIDDLNNDNYFETVFSHKNNEKILKIKKNYFTHGKNYPGTFTQLARLAPDNSTYFIDYPPNISESVYRILRLALHDKEIYYNPQGSFYNSRIDVRVPYYAREKERYDFLVLGKEIDPKSMCNCATEVFWKGFGNGVVVYKTIYLKTKLR